MAEAGWIADRKLGIGLFFGSFNPIHEGHVHFAEQCLLRLELDEVIFIPSCDSYPKASNRAASSMRRADMCEIAVRCVPGLSVSNVEAKSDRPCFTVDTVANNWGNNEGRIYLLMGEDTYRGLDRWYKANELRRRCRFAVARRTGKGIKVIGQEPELELPFEPRPYSSSEIRRDIAAGIYPAGLHPDVYGYIRKHGLYAAR